MTVKRTLLSGLGAAPSRFVPGASLGAAMILMMPVFLSGCHSVPITGRKQVLLMSTQEEASMGAQAFQQTLASERPSQSSHYVEVVNRVGQRLAAVADRPDFDWEFQVIQSPEQNAFCLPGGKVAVYEGILPICQTEAGLAVVMAHEVAHALARHGAERVSHGYLVDGVGKAVNLFAQKNPSDAVQKIASGYGVASNYGFVLPYSRKHESEADEIGIILMARAGYDPSEAPRFWQRFAQIKTGGHTPEFLSTHPSDERRANDLHKQLVRAQMFYNQAPQKFGMGEPLVFAPVQQSMAASDASGPPTDHAPTGRTQPATGLAQHNPMRSPGTPEPSARYPSNIRQVSATEPVSAAHNQPSEPGFPSCSHCGINPLR